jgi:hypothetical protein
MEDVFTVGEKVLRSNFSSKIRKSFSAVNYSGGDQNLREEHLKVIWTEFSTLSLAVLLQSNGKGWHPYCHFYS